MTGVTLRRLKAILTLFTMMRIILCRASIIPGHHLGPRHDDVYDDSGRHEERGRGADYGENIPMAFFSETVLGKVKNICLSSFTQIPRDRVGRGYNRKG